MKSSYISVLVIAILAICIAIAGCSSSPSSSTATGGAASTQAASSGGNAPAQATSAASAGAASSGGSLSAANIFGAQTWTWVEYKMQSQGMTIYFKYDKSGKCTMRFEGANVPQGMPSTMDCSSKGGQTANNPNSVASNVQFADLGPSPVTVGAGTFADAEKYSATVNGNTAYYWISKGKPLLKMEANGGQGNMELNGWG